MVGDVGRNGWVWVVWVVLVGAAALGCPRWEFAIFFVEFKGGGGDVPAEKPWWSGVRNFLVGLPEVEGQLLNCWLGFLRLFLTSTGPFQTLPRTRHSQVKMKSRYGGRNAFASLEPMPSESRSSQCPILPPSTGCSCQHECSWRIIPENGFPRSTVFGRLLSSTSYACSIRISYLSLSVMSPTTVTTARCLDKRQVQDHTPLARKWLLSTSFMSRGRPGASRT